MAAIKHLFHIIQSHHESDSCGNDFTSPQEKRFVSCTNGTLQTMARGLKLI